MAALSERTGIDLIDDVLEPKLVSHQMELERLFNKNQLMPRIKAEFTECKEFDFQGYMIEKGIDPDFGFSLLAQMALHKRCDLKTLVGTLRHHYDNGQQTADAILQCAIADLVDWDPQIRIFIVKFTLSADTQQEIDKFQFPLPMVVEPRELVKNTDSGYLTTGGSVILRKNHHNDDVCLDHINRMNKIKFSIDHETAVMVRNQWRNLDKAKEGETKQDFERRVRAFNKYDQTAKEVMDLIIKEGNEFYLTHKYDKRGRTYSQGYHVNYQGSPWNKAVISLTDKEVIS